MTKIAVLFFAGMLSSFQVSAEIYKCIDAGGKVHYGDKPCKGKSTIFTPRAGSKGDENVAERREKTERLLRAYREEHAEKQQLASERKAAKEQRTKNCTRARNRYRQMAGARRFYRIDKDGNYIDYTDKERVDAIAREQADIKEWCN